MKLGQGFPASNGSSPDSNSGRPVTCWPESRWLGPVIRGMRLEAGLSHAEKAGSLPGLSGGGGQHLGSPGNMGLDWAPNPLSPCTATPALLFLASVAPPGQWEDRRTGGPDFPECRVCAEQLATQSELIVPMTVGSRICLSARPAQPHVPPSTYCCPMSVSTSRPLNTSGWGGPPPPCASDSAGLCEPLKKYLMNDDGVKRKPRWQAELWPIRCQRGSCSRTGSQPGTPGVPVCVPVGSHCPKKLPACACGFGSALKKRVL